MRTSVSTPTPRAASRGCTSFAHIGRISRGGPGQRDDDPAVGTVDPPAGRGPVGVRQHACRGAESNNTQPNEKNRAKKNVLLDTDPRARCCRTPTGRRPAGGSTGRTARVIVTLPGPPREMRPMWADEVAAAARGTRRRREPRSGRCGSPASASRRSRSCWASRCCARPTRSSRPTRARRRSTCGSAPAARAARRPATSPTRPRRSCGPRSASTSGRAAHDVGGRARRGAGGPRLDARDDGARHGRGARRAAARARGGSPVRVTRRRRATTSRHGARDEARDLAEADRVRAAGGADVGLRARGGRRRATTRRYVAIATPDGTHAERRLVFLRGGLGADRAAIAARPRCCWRRSGTRLRAA